LLQTPAVIYCAVDSLIPPRGKIQPGFDDFSAALDHANIPMVWVTNRTRLQIDEPRRKVGHQHPFIAEGGSGVYLPEGYFNLRPEKSCRLGRFTCIPVAEPQPAAFDALEELAADTGVAVVPLRSLSPRGLAQNSGLPARESELVRQRDFDELFFFAGASDKDVDRFLARGQERKQLFRKRGPLWSLVVGASLKTCTRELGKLYQRALRSRPVVVGMATRADDETELFAACARTILFTSEVREAIDPLETGYRGRTVPLDSPDAWEQVLQIVTAARDRL
jgi:predicted mannosyl-3-phosphoglycerate phosphatase (HAD superfamily)